jgi:glycosyltransferase involved in cell wall biosynthesis
MTVFIVTDGPFPVGMAATNRMVSIARGLVERNIRVKVICLLPTEKPDQPIMNHEAIGNFHGVEFEYTCGSALRGETFLKRRWMRVRGILRSAAIIKKSKKNDAIILYLSSPFFVLLYFTLSRFFSLSLIQEKSEYPFVLQKKSFIGKMYGRLYTSCMYKMFDAIIVMTKPLEAYFLIKKRKKAKIIHIPMTVESSRFNIKPTKLPHLGDYIAYCGYLGGNKDGVPILVDSFKLVSDKHKDVKLIIIGDSPGTSDLEQLKETVKSLNLQDRVLFTGRISRDEIPRYLCNASILALARPTSLQSEGGFPTKLGEYLSTGNPVVVTKVGEIPAYLKDGYDAFLSEPDSPVAFAEKLDYVLSNPETAKEVGLRGRETAIRNFDYHVQSERLAEFLITLRGKV